MTGVDLRAIVLIVSFGFGHIDDCPYQPNEQGNKQHRRVN